MNPEFNFTNAYSIVFYLLVFIYLIIAILFFRRIEFFSIEDSFKRFLGAAVFYALLLSYLANVNLIWQYEAQINPVEQNINQETPIWRNQHCKPVQDPNNSCLNSGSGTQKYQCDNGYTYCAEL
jgi:lysylphosphatidylglycerol synthetase-like protein (DUF2156 family)